MAGVSEVLTADNMRKVVEEEGLEARNLLNWISDKTSLEVPKTSKKPPTSPRPQSASPKPPVSSKEVEPHLRSTNRCSSLGRPKSRLRSSSAGRNPEKCVRARYWAFLFENLYRAVDEIYQTCEVDESIVESKEAIMMLENYCKEFQALIQWLTISKNYEVTPPRNRPTSLAWEVRKSLPTKGLLRNIFLDKLGASTGGARRKIDLQGGVSLQSVAMQTDSEEIHIKKNESVGSTEILPSESECAIVVSSAEMTDDHALMEPHGGSDVDIVNSDEASTHSHSENFPSQDKSDSEVETVQETKPSCEELEVMQETKPSCEELEVMQETKPSCEELELMQETKPSCEEPELIQETKPFCEELALKSRIDVEFLGKNECFDDVDDIAPSDNICSSESVLITNDSVIVIDKTECLSGSSETMPCNVQCDVTVASVTSKENPMITTEQNVIPEKVVDNERKEPVIIETHEPNLLDDKKLDAATPMRQEVPIPIVSQKENKKLNKPAVQKTINEQPGKTQSAPAIKTLKSTPLQPLSSASQTGPVKAMTMAARIVKSVNSLSQPKTIVKTNPMLRKSSDAKTFDINASRKTTFSSSSNFRPNAHSQMISSKANLQKPSHQCKNPLSRSRPSEHHLGKGLAAVKSASCISLAGTYSSNGKNCSDGKRNSTEDADGWETVRSRTRCKNSPAKKVPVTNGAYDQAVAAKIIQSKMGGFPYTCTLNSQSVKQTTKPLQVAVKSGSPNIENCDSSTVKGKDPGVVARKTAKENIKPDSLRKVTSTKTLEKGGNRNVLESPLQTHGTTAKSLKPTANLLGGERKGSNDHNNPHFRKSYSSIGFEEKKSTKSLKNPSASVEINNKKNKLSLMSHKSNSIEVEKSKSSVANTLSAEDSNCSYSEDSNGLLTIDDLRKESLQKSEESPTETSEVSSTKENKDTSYDISSEEFDESMCQDDEGLNDTETLELYEKMIREEAQEYIGELGLSWGDQMDLLDMELRTPGRALQMHEKLSSPFRKRTLAETIRRQEEKQLKAQEQRERFLEEKAQRFKVIQNKVEEMKALNEKKQEQQRISLEQRLQRAEEKRKKELEKIVKKAHDEEEKVHEIAFINTLEAQNKRHDLISKEKDHEARLQDIQGERQRKLEEKAAKEAAAEERRKVLEAERQARLLEMQEKRKQRDLKIEQQLLEKEKERQELANQKARERELRISALNAAQQAIVEELQKKIQLKQEESARRHEENIEQIRQKAFELSVRRYSSNNDDAPQHVPYETKKICIICNVLIASEVYLLSHLRGKKHQQMISDQHQGQNPSTEELELYNLKHIVNATTDQIDPNIALDKERLKALKKRCKKLRQRMASRGADFERIVNSTTEDIKTRHKLKMLKLISDVKKHATTPTKAPWEAARVSALERTFVELDKLFEKCTIEDKVDFRNMGGITALMDVLVKVSMPILNNNTCVPNKVIVQVCKVTQSAFKNCHDNAIYVLLSNKIGSALDVMIHRLRVLIPDNFDKLVATAASRPGIPPVDEVAGEMMCFLATVLDCLAKRKIADSPIWSTIMKGINEDQEGEFQLRTNDAISYIVSIGIVDRLSQYFNSIRAAVDSEPNVATFLLHSMSFLMALVKMSSESYTAIFESKKAEDVTQLLATLKMTDLVGVVSLLYCILLHGGSPSLDETAPPQLPEHTLLLTLSALRMLNHSAVLNLHLVQNMLGSEGLSLQLRHIMSYLIWYCRHWPVADLLHEVILLLGFFTALNADNQIIIQAGQSASVLKQLSALPFNYFSDPGLTDILFPTFISCCFNSDANKAVLQREMSIELLSHYVEGYLLDIYDSSDAKKDPNIRWRLNSRFPKFKWTSAKLYFAQPVPVNL